MQQVCGKVQVSSSDARVSVSHTRPDNTTAYTAGDVVGTDPATNISFANVSQVNGGSVIITGVNIEVDVNAVPAGMSSFRLHIYDAAPTAIADNAAYNLPAADRVKYLGNIILDTPVDIGDTLWSDTRNVNMQCKLATGSTTLYGILETTGAFTPSALCVKKVTLNILGV